MTSNMPKIPCRGIYQEVPCNAPNPYNELMARLDEDLVHQLEMLEDDGIDWDEINPYRLSEKDLYELEDELYKDVSPTDSRGSTEASAAETA